MVTSNFVIKNDSSFDDLNNKNSSSHLQTIVIINCILNAPLLLVSIIGNAFVLTAILRTPSLRSEPSYIFLCSLAVSDLFVGFIAQPLYIASKVASQKISLVYDFGHTTAFFACGVSLCTMAAISVDRFIALFYHMRYFTLVTKSRVLCTLAVIWLINFLFSGIYFENRKVTFVIMASGICTCVLISTFSYIRIYRIVLRHQRQIEDLQLPRQSHSQIADFQLPRQSHSQIQDYQVTRHSHLQIEDHPHTMQSHSLAKHANLISLKKSAINTFAFYIFIVLCYVPKSISMIMFIISPTKWNKWAKVWAFASTLVFLNSSVNPLLYCWRIRELRTAVLKLSRKIFLRPPVVEN